jgi:serine/threonine-protein kinase
MTPERWSEIEAVYNEIADLTPAEQEVRLGAIADREMAREVRSLLGAGSARSMVASAVASVAGSAAAGGPLPPRFGPWRVTGVIGHGGMGAVYLGVRDDRAFDKQVAIKVLQLGFDSGPARERFRQERSILAGLEHPNIARLLDGGETEEGVSYIVMEYVEGGEPIVDYCVRRNLPKEERLGLFLQVASAVHLAHQRLVVPATSSQATFW